MTRLHMTTIVIRGGIPFTQTTVVIPTDLKERAREHGISMSAVLTKALSEEIESRGNGQ